MSRLAVEMIKRNSQPATMDTINLAINRLSVKTMIAALSLVITMACAYAKSESEKTHMQDQIDWQADRFERQRVADSESRAVDRRTMQNISENLEAIRQRIAPPGPPPFRRGE